MTTNRDALESSIRSELERWSTAEVPTETNLWPEVARRLQERNQGMAMPRAPRRRLTPKHIAIPALILLLTLSTLGVAAAASPAIRTALSSVWPFHSGPVSQGYSPTGAPLYMKPVPPFRVFYPTHIPASLGVHGVGHLLPGGLKNASPSPFGLTYPCPKTESARACGSATTTLLQEFPPAPSGPAFFPAVISGVARKGIEAVWFGFHAPLPGSSYISIGEWSASAYPTPLTGQPVSINTWPAQIQRHGNTLRVFLHLDGTAIVAETNTGQGELFKLLSSLHIRNVAPKR